MKLTALLKEWLVANCGVKADAADDEFRKAAGDAMATGKLAINKFQELSADPKEKEANEFASKLNEVASNLSKLVDVLSTKEVKEDKVAPLAEKAAEPKEKQTAWYEKMVSNLHGSDDHVTVDVKRAYENYSTTKSALCYPEVTKSGRPHQMAGKPVHDFSERGRPMDDPSELDRAVAGAYAKLLCATARRGGSKTFGFQSLPQHDRELLYYAMEKMPWSGSSDGGDFADIQHRALTPHERKALIDDSTSGGLEAAPIVFDDQVIQAPLLNGELFPLVNVVPLDRGRRVEGVSTGTVTGSWGGVDDTSITLFSTTSYVSAFDTTIFRWEGAIRIGLDFLSDTPIDFGQHVTGQYGERLLEDLDDVIAAGNGTTQPEGVQTKSGTTSVAWGGSTSIGNYESLHFGVHKREFQAAVAASAVFCGNYTSYQRMKAIPVGASDSRRLFGGGAFGTGGYRNFSCMDYPYKINESLANTQVFFGVMKRYRMYRRRGLTIRSSTEGDTLIRNNEMLMIALARYGGQLERGACAAITSTAPA